MDKIIYLDADFINKTTQVRNDTSTLFDKILELPYNFRITNVVMGEIKEPTLQRFLSSLVLDGKLNVVTVSDCIKALNGLLPVPAIENLVLSTLKKISNDVSENEKFYKDYFFKLEALAIMEVDINHFSQELENAIRNVPARNNIGEIVTLLNISLTNMIGEVDVISLLSHDSAARRCILSLHEKINSYDCYSCFYLLKQNGIINFTEAKTFVNGWLRAFPKNFTVKVMEGDSDKGIHIRDFVNMVFNQSGFTILRNGVLKKRTP